MMGVRAYARHRGCSLYAVQKAVRDNRVTAVERNAVTGRLTGIDQELADRQWQENTDPDEAAKQGKTTTAPPAGSAGGDLVDRAQTSTAPPASPSGGKDQGFYRARSEQAQVDLQRSRLELAEKIGLVISSAAQREVSARRYRATRDQLLNIPGRVCAILAAERDEARIHAILTQEIEQVLHELSDAARTSAAGGDPERVAA